MWWKTDKRYIFLGKILFMALLPILCCVVRCAIDGKNIFQVWLPGCQWNDELFYFKQVEAILQHGFPQGYYGFNESHALKLSFAAWSPVLAMPWVLWGAIFGWNLMSPILCNINLHLLCDSDKTKLEADWHFFSAVLPVYSHLEICFFSHAGGNLYLHGELVLLFCNSLYA